MAGIVIIGAGECGVRAALALRERGFDGPVTLIGAEEELPYERPPLSKDIQDEPRPIRPRAAFTAAGIDLRLGTTVLGIETASHSVRLSHGEPLGYDKLLLATGARARLFPGMEGCLTLRTAADAQAIGSHFKDGARIGIVGGGFIGLELAATARRAGAEVTLVEAAPCVLGRAVPRAIADIVRERHKAEGVRIIVGIGVAAAEARRITLADGTTRTFDAVIAGVGAVPNTALALDAGLSVDNGIVVDGNFSTTDPDIHAAGDCCNFPWHGVRVRLESWRAAQDQGTHVAAAMLGAQVAYAKVPWFWSDQYDLTLQVTGLFEMTRPVRSRTSENESRIVFQCDDAGRLIAAAGIGPCTAVAKDIRILEKLIERSAVIDPNVLADPSQNLKRHLKAA